MTFSEKLFELRKKNGLSQEELATKLGVSRQAVSRWELGNVLPDVENVVQLSELFGVSTDYLLKDELDVGKNTVVDGKKNKQQAIEKEKNAMTGLVIVMTLHTLAFLLSLYGYIEKNVMAIVSGILIQAVLFGSFEMSFAWYKKQGMNEVNPKLHIYYHMIAVWLVVYFPIWLVVTVLFRLYPRPYLAVIPELITLIIYLVVCISITKKARKKMSSLA